MKRWSFCSVHRIDLVELEAQALELGREPGREGRVGALAIDRVDRLLGVVEPASERVLPAEERLEIGVAAVVLEALAAGDHLARVVDVLELLVVPQPLRAEHEALVELAGAGLVAQRRVDSVQEPGAVLGDREEGPAELEVQRVREVEVGGRMHEPGQLVEGALLPEASDQRRQLVLFSDRVVDAARHAEVVLDRSQPGELRAFGPALAGNQAIDRGRPIHERKLLHVPVREAADVGEEAAALHGQVPRQRRGDERRLLDVEALLARADDRRVAAQEGIDRRREEELALLELEVPARA